MFGPGVLGAIGGFLSALIALVLPMLRYLQRIDNRAAKAVRLLTGAEEIEDDGLIARVRRIEEETNELEEKIQELKADHQ